MKLRGEDIASSVRDWLNEEVKKGPSSRHELGRFLFGVSTGTLTLFVALLKFAVVNPSLDFTTVGCFTMFLLASVVGLYMAIPNVLRIKTNLELYEAYNNAIGSFIRLVVLWFSLWVVGFFLGSWKLFS